MEEAQEEARTLTQLEQAKTAVIEKLTAELSQRNSASDVVVQLQNQLKAKEKEIVDVNDELTTMQHVLQQKESALRQLMDADGLRDERSAWVEERRFLQGQIRKHAEAKAAAEKAIKVQEQRLQQLQARVDFFARTMRETQPREGAELDASVTASAKSFADGDMQGDIVPLGMYEALEKAVQALHAGMRERDALLQDKDDAVLVLKRKNDVLKHASVALERRLDLETSQLKAQVEQLQEELAARDEMLRAAERELEIAKHSRAAALKAARRHENELFGEMADLKLMLQKRDTDTTDREAALRKELDEVKTKLGSENARLKTQLEEVLALHDDIRAAAPDAARRTRIYIVIHSANASVRALADAVAEGARSVPGVDCVMWRVPRLQGDVVEDNAESQLPVATADKLADADAMILGAPATLGNVCAEMRAFLDQTGRLWASGSLVGKVRSICMMLLTCL